MSIRTIVETVKKVHKEDIVLIKVGNFYRAYGKDSYILSYFFEYKLKEEDGVISCGFPINSLKKVQARLENEKINYLILDRSNNYEEDEKYDNKNLNSYQKVYEKARKEATYLIRVDKIVTYLQKNYRKADCKKIILQMEELINEK